ncbi:hypothetical protein [Nocardioides iriomotensis]|uniref:Alpha/beta hydrolase n=1 Tax=Nocardioides iriomotensis TaxID=715784 RepID=A0A4Q5J8B1_9ACTN|nr:hypothetical protein [Nocardioides iriomotensis]RYU14844.1 hypothetical protein ETU37_02335 [Nocardioides iriomotensis]
MTERPDDFDPDLWFEPNRDAESAATSSSNEPTNVCRVAALSSMLAADEDPLRGLQPELSALGFAERLATGEVPFRHAAVEELRESAGRSFRSREEQRVEQWAAINQAADVASVYDFLLSVLQSPLERESAAAAVAIARDLHDQGGDGLIWSGWLNLALPDWDPWQLPDPELLRDYFEWDDVAWNSTLEQVRGTFAGQPLLWAQVLVELRLRLALRSADPVTRSLVHALFLTDDTTDIETEELEDGHAVPNVSLLIHGTNAWQGDWWRPGKGTFHHFVLSELRRDLYRGGARFGWNGYLRDTHRTLAARDLLDWAADLAPYGLRTVFAHSYGSDVAAKSWIFGLPVEELVLLSAPVNKAVVMAAAGIDHVVDVRLPFDPVLACARLFQRVSQSLPPLSNVDEVLLKWSLHHGASHDPLVWKAEDVVQRGHLI